MLDVLRHTSHPSSFPLRRIIARLLFFILSILPGCLPAPMPPVIKIGLVAPFEGRYRYIGYDAIYAARLAVQEINTSDILQGLRLELVAYDDHATPELARNAAQNLTIDSDVVAVIGHYHEASTTAAQELYAQANLPLLVIGTDIPHRGKLTWHLAPSPTTLAQAMLEKASTTTRSKTFVLWGEGDLVDALRAELQQTEAHVLDTGSLTQTGQLSATILSTTPPHSAAEALLLSRQQQWQGQFIGSPDCTSDNFGTLAGEASNGAYIVTPYPRPQDLTQTEDWIARYQSMGPHVAAPGPYALPTYEAVYILAQAIAEAAQTHTHTTRENVAESLAQIQRTGYLGTIAWDSQGYWANPSFTTYTWQENQLQKTP